MAVFFDGVDTRKMSVEVREDGKVCVTQVVSGRGVVEVFGTGERLTQLRLEAQAARKLEGLLDPAAPNGALGRFINKEDHDLLDLVDLCDSNGIEYSQVAMGAK